ncbi:prolipoprotein diacylglyceryl transferase [Flammeovirgaceae bacterium 311]|nr:prolipoprotein diacylglyceryl transferase [Flammeovirgaceae bacterium 311]
MNYIIWDPNSIIVNLGFFALRWYSLMFAIGFGLSYLMLLKLFARDGVPQDKLDKLVIYVVLATIIGARLGHCLFYDFEYYSRHISEIFLPFTFEPHFQFVGFMGLASHGAIIGILGAVMLYSYLQKIPLFWLLDKLALVSPLVCGLIRIGNLLNSEIVGTPTTAPWAFIFTQLDGIPRHPSQLYEALAYLSVFVFINILYRKSHKQQGFIFGVFLTLMFLARFTVEFFKEDQSAFEAGMLINMGQVLSIPFIIIGLILIMMKRKTRFTSNSPDLAA